MSTDAFVFCRARPDLPEHGAFCRGRFPFELRSTSGADADELRRCGGDPTTYPWVVAVEVTGEWYDAFLEGGTVIARRCGGGLLWSARWTRAQSVAPRAATSTRSLFAAAERGFDESGDEDVGTDEGPPMPPAAPPGPSSSGSGRTTPSARAMEHVTGMARSMVGRDVAVAAHTRLADLGIGPDSWGGLLIGAGFNEFELLDDPAWRPETIEDVARIFDEMWAHDDAVRIRRSLLPPPPRAAPIDIGSQLAELEAKRVLPPSRALPPTQTRSVGEPPAAVPSATPGTLPTSPPAIRWARIAALLIAGVVPAVALGAGLIGGGVFVLSPRKLLILGLVVYQLRALFVVPGPRVVTVNARGDAFQLGVVAVMGLLAMYALFGPNFGMQVWAHAPFVFAFNRALPWGEMNLFSPGDFMQAPLLALLIHAVDVFALMAIGGPGFDVVLDGQHKRVVYGWLRRSVPFSAVRGLALAPVQIYVYRGSLTLQHAVVRLVDGGRIVLPTTFGADASTLEALSRATGLPILSSTERSVT